MFPSAKCCVCAVKNMTKMTRDEQQHAIYQDVSVAESPAVDCTRQVQGMSQS